MPNQKIGNYEFARAISIVYPTSKTYETGLGLNFKPTNQLTKLTLILNCFLQRQRKMARMHVIKNQLNAGSKYYSDGVFMHACMVPDIFSSCIVLQALSHPYSNNRYS